MAPADVLDVTLVRYVFPFTAMSLCSFLFDYEFAIGIFGRTAIGEQVVQIRLANDEAVRRTRAEKARRKPDTQEKLHSKKNPNKRLSSLLLFHSTAVPFSYFPTELQSFVHKFQAPSTVNILRS